MNLLTKEQQESSENSKNCYVCKNKFGNKYWRNKKYHKVRDNCHYTGSYRGAVRSICNSKNNVPKKMPTVFHNGSNYDYHLIIKELPEVFKNHLLL